MQAERSPKNATADVVSEPLVYPNRAGLKVAAFWDHRTEEFRGCPFVILAPKYSETKKNNLQLGYALAANGLNVIRFDHTCHVGESGGDRMQFSMRTALDDISGTVDLVEDHFGGSSIGLVGSSLSARPALRAAASDPRVGFFVSIVGVINFCHTARRVYGEDVVADYLNGRRWGTHDVIGFEVDFDRFLDAAVGAGLHDLAGAQADVRSLACPAVFYAAENDTWVDLDDVRALVACSPQARLHPLANAMHEVRENPVAAGELFRDLARTCVQLAYGSQEAPSLLLEPTKRNLLRQNRTERERLRQLEVVNDDESSFWREYLGKFNYIQNGNVYREYLDLVIDLLMPMQPGEIVIDAGSGNGFAGLWIQRVLAAHPGTPVPPSPLWLSLDLTECGLAESMVEHVRAGGEGGTAASSRVDYAYLQVDFDRSSQPGGAEPLAWLEAGSVDAVLASLLISYLKDPTALVAEFHRVLRPDGRIIVSSMKPHCDLSLIYRTFVEQGASAERLTPARNLLSAAGAIRLKEELGFYRFFAADEMVALLRKVGFRHCTSFSAMGNQAVVIRAQK